MKRLTWFFTAAVTLFAALTACAQKKADTPQTKDMGKTLIAYFSATGTTEGVARLIADATGGDLYKIEAEQPYSAADLDWTDPASRSCRENADPQVRPAFRRVKPDLSAYDTIYLGYPIWWDQAPRIVNTFIEAYGLKGKTVIPFATSGGSGVSNSVKVLKAAYPDIRWESGALLNHATAADVEAWLAK